MADDAKWLAKFREMWERDHGKIVIEHCGVMWAEPYTTLQPGQTPDPNTTYNGWTTKTCLQEKGHLGPHGKEAPRWVWER